MVNCPNCGQPNPAGARFCNQCGTGLAAVCSHCGQANPREARFCNNCGRALPGRETAAVAPPGLTDERPESSSTHASLVNRFLPPELATRLAAARAAGAMLGERRVVTMLFCDLKGSTAAAEQLDPEEWADIMNGAFEHMIQPIYRFEGTVARLMGDAILAFFGAPIAHEDDPQRAVLAGLAIVAGIRPYRDQVRRDWGLDFDVRVGINTGLVMVGAIGADLRLEYTAMGDAINLAARMEQTAAPGTVQIAADTYRHVAPFFDIQDLGGIPVKGRAEPVPAFRVLGRRATPGRLRGIAGLEAPLIGRDHEQTVLAQSLARLHDGRGGLVFLLGEAGLGKSRLLEELRQASTRNGDGPLAITWYQTTSLSYETEQPYALFRRLVRRVVQARPDESPAAMRDHIQRLAAEAPPADRPTLQRVFESLFGLPGADGAPPLEGETFKGLLYTVMTALWQRRSDAGPVVLLCDDLHWSDPASVALLQHLFPLTDRAAFLLLCALRPEPEAPGWQARQLAEQQFPHRTQELRLQPLSPDESGQLVDSLLRIANLPAPLRRRIMDRSEGNPFYVEEVVRSLIDRAVVVRDESGHRWRATGQGEDLEIPDNLQTLLVARIDRLAEAARHTLQLAAVVGRAFYYRVLQRLVRVTETELEGHLLDLQRAQLILEAARRPEREYHFRHALTQEAAYSTILLKQRRAFHRRVGTILEELFPEQPAELAGVLARHFDVARDWPKAFHYYVLAGDGAYRLHAHREAVDLYGRALAHLGRVAATGEQIIQLFSRYGRSLEHRGDFETALGMYRDLAALAAERADQPMALASLVARGTVRAMQGPALDFDRAESLTNEGLVLAQALGDRVAEAKIHWNRSRLHMIRGRPGDEERALSYGQASLAIAREMGLSEQMALTLSSLAGAYRNLNRPAEADAALEEAQQLFERVGNLPMLADAVATMAYFLSGAGEFDAALAAAQKARRLSQSIGNLWNQGSAAFTIGLVYRERGQLGAAVQELEAALRLPGIEQLTFVRTILSRRLMRVYLALGAADEARALWPVVDRGTAGYPVSFRNFFVSVLAQLQLFQGDLSDAHSTVTEVVAGLNKSSIQNAAGVAGSLLVAADIELSLGRHEQGLQLAVESEAFVDRFNMGAYRPRALLLKGQALLALDQVDAAAKTLGRARRDAESRNGRLALWQILAALARVSARKGRAAEAADLERQARALVEYISAHVERDELRASFLSRPDVARLMAPDE